MIDRKMNEGNEAQKEWGIGYDKKDGDKEEEEEMA
jgi:hypothetical protein